MHSLSDIYGNISIHSVLLWLALMFLITGIFNKKSSLSIFSIIIIAIAWYQMSSKLTAYSISSIGVNMMLISAIAYFGSRIKKLSAHLTYLVFASAIFLIAHSYTIQKASSSFSVNLPNESLDQEAELLVKFNSQSDLQKWISSNKNSYDIIYPAFTPIDKSYSLDEYLIVNLKPTDDASERIIELEKNELVAYVEGNEILELKLPKQKSKKETSNTLSTNDPYSGKQWMAKKFDLEKFHNQLPKISALDSKKQSTIAILDTGVDSNHEDLSDNYISTSESYDNDKRGHGTHCAGIAAAVTGNKIGISSWIPSGASVKVTSIKVLSSSGIGSQRTIVNGILEAADEGYDIISMSLGGRSNPNRERTYKDAVQYANDKGAIVIVAAGNSSMDAIAYSPANTPGVIAVSAIDSNLELADFSNKIDNITYGIAAPGTDIYSTLPDNRYGPQNGTSMAAPFVSGVVGLMRLYNPNLNTQQVYDYLRESAINNDGQIIINPIGAFQLMMQAAPAE